MILIENKTLFAFYIYIFSFEDLIPAPFSSQMLIMTWLSWFLYTRIVSFDKTTCDEQHCGCLNVCGTWMENQLPSKGQNSDPETYCQRVQRTIEKKISYSRNHEDVKLSWFKFQEKRDFFFFFFTPGFKLALMLSLPLRLLQCSHLSPGFITSHTTHSVLGRQSSCHFCLAGVSLLPATATSDLFLSLSQDRWQPRCCLYAPGVGSGYKLHWDPNRGFDCTL